MKRKICAHVTAKCANCERNLTANSLQYISKHKTDIEARKKKKSGPKKKKKKTQVENTYKAENKETKKSIEFNIEIDLEDEI